MVRAQQRTRADLGRFLLTLDEDDEVRLEILVVESKFRQTFDLGAAEQQLDRTTELCQAAFRSGDASPDDREFWLQELAAAVEQTSAIRQTGAELPARRCLDLSGESPEARIFGALRTGQVALDSVQASPWRLRQPIPTKHPHHLCSELTRSSG